MVRDLPLAGEVSFDSCVHSSIGLHFCLRSPTQRSYFDRDFTFPWFKVHGPMPPQCLTTQVRESKAISQTTLFTGKPACLGGVNQENPWDKQTVKPAPRRETIQQALTSDTEWNSKRRDLLFCFFKLRVTSQALYFFLNIAFPTTGETGAFFPSLFLIFTTGFWAECREGRGGAGEGTHLPCTWDTWSPVHHGTKS